MTAKSDAPASMNLPKQPSLQYSLLARIHLRYMFPDLSTVNDEFERIEILVLLDQLEINESPGLRNGRAARKPASRRFNQPSREFVLAVGVESFDCLQELAL